MPVDVHWVLEGDGILEDDTNRFIGSKVVGVPLRIERVGCVAFVG